MKMDTYDSQKLDKLKDNILGLIQGVDGGKEKIPEICTVLRNVQDTLSLENDILGLIHAVDHYRERTPEICTVLLNVLDILLEREKTYACGLLPAMPLNEDNVRRLSDYDVRRLLRTRRKLGAAQFGFDAYDKRERELRILEAELKDRASHPFFGSCLREAADD